MNEPTDTTNVSVDTDDLDAFETLFHGNEPTEVKTEPKETVVENDDDSVTDDVIDKEEATPDSEDSNADSKEEDEVKEDVKPKKVNRVQERINQLLERERIAKEENANLLKRLEALENKQTDSATKQPDTQTGSNLPDPDAKNEDGSDKYPLGEFDPSYIRDLNRVIIEEERQAIRAKEEQESKQRQDQEARDALQNQWVSKLEPVTEQYEDFFDKTIELESTFEGLDAGYSDYLVQTIKSLDHGPEVLYYFANNLEQAQEFVKMGPLQATLALGEINAMFKSAGKKETKVSKAPPPPQVNKGANIRKVVTADTDDLDAFEGVFFSKKK